MDFETFKKAVDSLKGFRGIVGIMGGEPTIHPEFERFIAYYRENTGYDDDSSGLLKPSADYMRHVLANGWHVDYTNHRGLWTSVTPRYYKHFELIQDTFGYQLLNDHSNPSMHQTHMVTRRELGIADDEWIKLRDRCWVQNLWSASITPKGAFFCEIAAAMDATLNGPGGWPIEPGWWQRKPEDFKEQLEWCEMCSACLPMPSRNANDETDDVSPVWAKKLAEINSPKLRKGLVNTFDPVAYKKDHHSIIQVVTPYMEQQEDRMGKSRNRLVPQHIIHVALLSDNLTTRDAREYLTQQQANGHLDAVASGQSTHATLAMEFGVPALIGDDALNQLRSLKETKDWVIMSRDKAASAAFHDLIDTCVFNPGVIYQGSHENSHVQFFNLRAAALKNGGNLFDIAATYPSGKRIEIAGTNSKDYRLSNIGIFLRRAYKRIHWIKRKLKGQPTSRGPIGELKGNRIR